MTPGLSLRLAAAHEHLKQNRVQAADAEIRAVLKVERDNAAALTLLAVVFLRQGQVEQAEAALDTAIATAPAQRDAIGLLAVVRKSRGDWVGAIQLFQRLIGLGMQSPDLFNQLGTCQLQADDPVSAGASFKRAIELDRMSAQSVFNLGMALKMAGNSFETFTTFKRAQELNPNSLETYVELWQQMRKLLNWSEGLPILEKGLRKFPDSAQMLVILASTYGKVGKLDRAEELYLAATRIDATAGPSYAHWLQEEGRFDDSIPVLKEAVLKNPIQGQAYYNLAVAKCFEVDGRPLVEVATPLLEQEGIGPEGRMFLYYTLAKAYEQQKDYQEAMRNYDLANDAAYRLFNSRIVHDAQAVEFDHATLVKIYSESAIAQLRKHGSESSTPIFIIGMIRTGTTLLDQILSSHRKVKSAGEQPFWQVSAGRVNRGWLQSGGNADDVKRLEKEYLAILRTTTGGASRITDKMPTNFTHMGLMSIVFPKAKFVHLRRNPLDTCLSIYTTFLGSGTQFAYNQENIVGYYRAYLRTMEHWRAVIPAGQMIEIDYEDLVSDKERVLRELLEFCGLEWDEACLHHEENRSQVSTPSLWTARQPVNTASVERWRRYEPWLGALLELRDAAHPKPAA